MAIPELDLKKVNLQAAVGYLISLHDNEVDWNLLGIKVIGHIDALPIPEGTYEYGDAYMVGTEPPYDMYIYTRPDGAVHTEGYWFPIGKFPMPGPKGPKGDGIEQVYDWTNGTVRGITYDTTDGAKVTQTTTVDYTDSTDGSTKHHQFDTTTTLPIASGKYISIKSNNKKMIVSVDDTALALDYIKLDKTKDFVLPLYSKGVVKWISPSVNPNEWSIVQRDENGGSKFVKLYVNRLATLKGQYDMPLQAVYYGGASAGFTVEKTPTDTGTLTVAIMEALRACPNAGIEYGNQRYIRMDTTNGTLNFIHIDNIEDGNGGYKATGKCFSVTVSTRAWQVVDLDFGGSTTYKHTTQMHVVIPGDDDYYLTIFTTDNHGAMYNLNSASTLLDNIGTAGTIAYKQNTANGVYIPVHISKTSSGNWEWNMGSASGTFTTNQIDTITDDYETIV